MADKDASDYVDEMGEDITLDQIFDRDPSLVTDDELEAFVHRERQKRADFIKKEAER